MCSSNHRSWPHLLWPGTFPRLAQGPVPPPTPNAGLGKEHRHLWLTWTVVRVCRLSYLHSVAARGPAIGLCLLPPGLLALVQPVGAGDLTEQDHCHPRNRSVYHFSALSQAATGKANKWEQKTQTVWKSGEKRAERQTAPCGSSWPDPLSQLKIRKCTVGRTWDLTEVEIRSRIQEEMRVV